MSIINSQPRIGAAGQSTGGYRIERSLRFNSADSAYLNRTPASAGNKQTWTWSGWVKRGALSSFMPIYSAGPSSPRAFIAFSSADKLDYRSVDSGNTEVIRLVTTQVFRDPSAWYHIVVAQDTTQATAANRVKIYVNGVQVTAFSTETYPSQNASNLAINDALEQNYGRYVNSPSDGYLSAYITETYFIDGSAKTPSDFGETDTDTGVWKPKAYSGSYGTNGFYLKFADNSGTTSTTLGKDSSGNGNNWTPNNFSVTAGAGNDSLVDTPTPYGTDTGAGGEVRGNYATLNPNRNTASTQGTFSNGNLQIAGTNGVNNCYAAGTMAFAGKMYCEITITAAGGDTTTQGVGIVPITSNQNAVANSMSTGIYYIINGNKRVTGTSSSYGSSYTTGDVIGIAVDVDAETVTFYKNNVSQGSISGTGVISAGVVAYIGFQDGGSPSITANFGQRPFAYTAPSGFKALCTQNLPTPTIGATATTRADDYFNTVLYTGNGSTQTISGVGFQPDFVWCKSRSNAYIHTLIDAVRGRACMLFSNATTAEYSTSPSDKELTAFTSDGFSLGPDLNYSINSNGATFAAWNWKANGAGSSNTQGTITSTVSANTASGFSIVTYTGNGTSGATVGHGLGVTPSMVMIHRRDAVSNWQVKHVSLNADQNLELNSTAAVDTAPGSGYISAISSTTLTLLSGGAITNVNTNGGTYLAYCFAPVAGYSAFGSYTGNGSSDGPFVYTGFRPAWVLFKLSSASGIDWIVFDAKRNTYNAVNSRLFPSLSNAEADGAPCDFLSNGFKMRENNDYHNRSGATYVYAAFAEVPTKFSLAR